MNSETGKKTYLNNSEQLALLRQPNPKAPTGLRNLCLITLMLKTGLRVGEVINLREKAIDWVNGKIAVGESGTAGSRMLWVGDSELRLLEQWRLIKPHYSQYFFSTLDGNRIKDRYVREMVKRLARKAGLGNNIHPNLLRATFAIEFYREFGDLKLLQQSLGHSDLSTTRAYAKQVFGIHFDQHLRVDHSRRSGAPCLDSDYSDKGLEYDDRISVGKETRPTGIAYNQVEANNKNDGKSGNHEEPVISVFAEQGMDKNEVSIPALKCSQCSYVLRYRGDCPRCGTSFIDILRHWGRNV